MSNVDWIKITTDMFDNRKIKHLRKMPEGNNIVLIWVMLLTMAGKCNFNGTIFLTEDIPYTPKMLADELDFEESTVLLALRALEGLGMIVVENGNYSIANWAEYQNVEGLDKIREQGRIRAQRYRDKQKALAANPFPALEMIPENEDVTQNNVTVTEQNRTDEKKKIKNDELEDFFNSIWKLYPRHKNDRKSKVTKTRKKELQKIGFDRISEAIERYLRTQNPNYRHAGHTFFNEIIDNLLVSEEAKKTPQPTYIPEAHIPTDAEAAELGYF